VVDYGENGGLLNTRRGCGAVICKSLAEANFMYYC
jgi:hypothetical protein